MARVTKQEQINTCREINDILRREVENLKEDKKRLFASIEMQKLEIAKSVASSMATCMESLSKLVLSINGQL